MVRLSLGLLLCLIPACLSAPTYGCESDDQCGAEGRCEESGFCSFPDEDCESGFKYGPSAGGLSKECVESDGNTTGSTTTSSTTTTTSPTDGSDTVMLTSAETTAGPTVTTDPGCPDWWDCAWGFRRQMTFDNSQQAEALADFPVLITLTPGDVDFSAFLDGGLDLRFVDRDDLTELPHEIEFWTSDGDSTIWVGVPEVEGVSNSDYIWMYYGNPGATDVEDPAGVWKNGYAAVYHLDSALLDSSPNGNDATNQSSADTLGVIGRARDFNGSAGWISAEPSATLDDVFAGGGTISAWLLPAGWGLNDNGQILDKAATTAAESGYALALHDGQTNQATFRFRRGFDVQNGVWNAPSQSISLDAWQYMVVVYDDLLSNPTLYVDAMSVGVTDVQSPAGTAESDAAQPLWIGNRSSNPNRTFDGSIDEVRISSVTRSGDWIAAQHLSMTGAFVTIGAEQAAP